MVLQAVYSKIPDTDQDLSTPGHRQRPYRLPFPLIHFLLFSHKYIVIWISITRCKMLLILSMAASNCLPITTLQFAFACHNGVEHHILKNWGNEKRTNWTKIYFEDPL